MEGSYLLREPEAWKMLAKNLEKSKGVVKFDQGQEREAWILAHAFADLEQSFRKVLDEYFPKLMAPEIESDNVHDLLLDIGEELRHIIYHVKDSRFFNYLNEAPEVRQP